ncbi:hypothetical protein BDR07DRAFT_1395566 [Suillus spraguei]|nr:hypothetical protein BDR07DRAFT_1395566 [Suillus spraguei]
MHFPCECYTIRALGTPRPHSGPCEYILTAGTNFNVHWGGRGAYVRRCACTFLYQRQSTPLVSSRFVL